MKILHQRADGPEETVGLTKEDREAQVETFSQQRLILSQQVTIIRQNVIDSMGVRFWNVQHVYSMYT